MAHYVITGGTGFVGQALCRRLAARGVALTVLTRDRAQRRAGCRPARAPWPALRICRPTNPSLR